MKPIIGISVNFSTKDEIGKISHLGGPLQHWHLVADDYVKAIEKAGGIPILIPAYKYTNDISTVISKLDGMVFTGGNDIEPKYYDEIFSKVIGEISPRRDSHEIALIDYIIRETRLPILGICRGHQLINIALGGSLYKDMKSSGMEDHFYLNSPMNHLIHKIDILEKSKLKKIVKEATIDVNSFHHQCIKEIGKGGHGAAPHMAIDPIPAVAEILSALNLITAREIDPLEPCILSIGTVNTPSSSWNIIPQNVEIIGTFRTFSKKVRETIANRIEGISKNIAKAHKCQATCIRMKGYDPTINHEEMVKLVKESSEKYLDKVHIEKKPFTGGEDFGAYLNIVPGALIWLGCGDPKESNRVFAHNPAFKVDLNSLILGTQVHINTALSYLKGRN